MRMAHLVVHIAHYRKHANFRWSNIQFQKLQSKYIKHHHRLSGRSGRTYSSFLSACCGTHSDVNDRTTEYEKPGSFEEHQNESK
jgi:hypothetical protein